MAEKRRLDRIAFADTRPAWLNAMKIMAVIASLPRGGAERVLSLLTQEWATSHEVIVVAFDGVSPAYACGGRLVDLGLAIPSNVLERAHFALASVLRLVGLFRRERPDRIVSFMEPANFPAAIGAAVTGLRQHLTVSVHHNPAVLPIVRRVLIPWIYRLPFRVVAVSEGVRDVLEYMGVPAMKVLTIPNPVVARAGPTPQQSPFPMRYILGAGRLRPEKGFDRLLKAFSNVDRTDLHLVILGDGVERGALVGLSHELGIGDRVHLPGAVSDIDTWYQHAECFVLSSRSEAWPMVLVEAMANGCPVVSFRCNYGPPEIIEDSRSGILVNEGDVEALADAIGRVSGDARLRIRLASSGKIRATMFDVRVIAGRWVSD